MGFERNLIIVHTPTKQALSDFTSISALIGERAPDIEVFIVTNGNRHSVTRRKAADRPTLVFSPTALREFEPIRGKVYQARRHTKFGEYQRMIAGGVDVPTAVMVEPGTKLDPATWGPFTVLKPNVGGQGKGVRLWRTRDVHWIDPGSWPRDDPRHGIPLLAQRFVDTGEFTHAFRVLLVLGRPIYATVSRWRQTRQFDLDPDGDEPLDMPIASNAGDRSLNLCDDAEVIAFGRRVAPCFPELAVLGVDVVREQSTGRLLALEANTGGTVWHISSDYAVAARKKLGVTYDPYTQFGALDVIADALIETTRREAT